VKSYFGNFNTIIKISFKEDYIMSKSVSFLYQLAIAANDIEKLSSGDPKRIARRAKNKYIGRKLVRKVWKFPF